MSRSHRSLSTLGAPLLAAMLLGCAVSSDAARSAEVAPAVALDSVNSRIVRAYHDKDPRAYAALYTDSAQFEWAAIPTVHGRAGMEAMARELWTPLPDLDLKLIVATRRIATEHATEFGAFEESWRDSTGGRTTEYGRYVVLFARAPDDSWRIDRFFGFSDSTGKKPPAR